MDCDNTGKYVVSSSLDNQIRIYDVQESKITHKIDGKQNAIWKTCFSSNSKYIGAGTGHSSIVLYDVQTGNEVCVYTYISTYTYTCTCTIS